MIVNFSRLFQILFSFSTLYCFKYSSRYIFSIFFWSSYWNILRDIDQEISLFNAMIHDDVKNDEFKFFKLVETQNYRKWNKNMTNALQTAKVWNLVLDIENPFRKRERKLFYEHQKKQDVKQNIYDTKCFKIRDRIVVMCQSKIQIIIDSNDESQKMWIFLKIRFESTNWVNKWTIINRFEKIHYNEIKNIVIYNEKLTKIKQKITNLNIFMSDVFVIKVLNNFSSNFHTFLAIKNNEIRTQKKLS